jgi:hypothetical protein
MQETNRFSQRITINGEAQCGVQVFVIDNIIKISLIVTIFSELKGGGSGPGQTEPLEEETKDAEKWVP